MTNICIHIFKNIYINVYIRFMYFLVRAATNSLRARSFLFVWKHGGLRAKMPGRARRCSRSHACPPGETRPGNPFPTTDQFL